MAPVSSTWIHRFLRGPHFRVPRDNFSALKRGGTTLFSTRIEGKPIDLFVYNADTGDLLFGRANLQGGYPRELAHHVGLVRRYLKLTPKQEEKFSQGSLDIAVDHSRKEVYFKHLTIGLEDMLFPEDMEWITHIGSLQDLAMQVLREIGMPTDYNKIVVKAKEWARIRTGLLRGKAIPYEEWKKHLKGGGKK